MHHLAEIVLKVSGRSSYRTLIIVGVVLGLVYWAVAPIVADLIRQFLITILQWVVQHSIYAIRFLSNLSY